MIFFDRLGKDDFQKLVEHNPSLLKSIEAIALEHYELVRAAELSYERRQSYAPSNVSFHLKDPSYDWVSRQR